MSPELQENDLNSVFQRCVCLHAYMAFSINSSDVELTLAVY